jgi:hypothetical protein
MQIITTSVDIIFAICLAALAAAPALIAIWREFRVQKHFGVQQSISELATVNPPPVPFNYPPRERLREGDQSSITEPRTAQEHSSELHAVYPPPVPFNSQIFWRSVHRLVEPR